MTDELVLEGGRSASEVVRIDNTVRRSIGPQSERTHKLLKLLEEKAFGYAPRYLGIDDKGREILTYVDGLVSHGDYRWTDEQLARIVGIMRKFHDATAGSELAGDNEVVCHNDIAPWNIVVKDGVPIAIIDFDNAAPGNRVDDLAYALWNFLEIGADIPASLQGSRMRQLSGVYGYPFTDKLLYALIGQQEKILAMRLSTSMIAPQQEQRDFSKVAAESIRGSIAWVKDNWGVLESAL